MNENTPIGGPGKTLDQILEENRVATLLKADLFFVRGLLQSGLIEEALDFLATNPRLTDVD